MTAILLAIATSFIITFLVIPVIIKYSKKKSKLLDTPGRRKIHKKITPSMGGIGIFSGFFVALLVWLPLEGFEYFKYILAGTGIIFLVGMRDDIVPLRPLNKLIGQLIASSIVVLFSGVRLHSLYGLFGINELNEVASYLLTIFTFIVVTNSFNLIDGLDGLAGTIATIALGSFGIWFYLIDQPWVALLALSVAGAVVAFLTFNWEPSKIFMGDTGALVLGFLFSVLVITFIDANYNLPVDSPFRFRASITSGICVVIIPLFDTLRIFILRLSKKQSPFAPDKNHIHHALMRLGMKHSQTALALGFLNIVYILLAIICMNVKDAVLLPILIIFSVVLSLTLDFLIIRKLNR
ncbi:undecaprenyl/decaprenyl-phosphate alpha-N-acetylglucosaminyl 1-phosphate transferase [Fulvivirga maritima]|uniref:MraY family glycosyltransferase n=1 Tax=Fulvivirga maritima TaxID=2904247 RepID=UPI001F2362BB|nr:MraY family glycosyltransferase [Fulvivirga maritima]UII27943.1 undecaprenyl/decaprenyl-phosphate alpha-N-acetylglucosaminyl 1-phosphate transferase [Fulvivirga maritima]